MGQVADGFAQTFRDYETDGVPSSGAHYVSKAEARDLGALLETVMSAIGAGIRRFATVAAMNADATGPDGALAYVYLNNGATNDPANGVYQWKAGTATWVEAEWYFAAVAAVVQPLIDQAEDYRDQAEAAVASLTVNAATERQRKWEAMLTQLAARNVPRGLVDVTDYGLDPLPAFWNVLLYWTGAVLYPIRKVDANFHEGHRDGDVSYVAPNGDLYYSVSIPKLFDPSLNPTLAVTAYHAAYATGTDDTAPGRGATAGDPYKSLDYALVRAKAAGLPFVIHYYGDFVGANGLFNSSSMTMQDGLKGKVEFHPTTRRHTWIVPQRENLTKASFGWVAVGNGTYRCSVAAAAVPDAVKKAMAQVDALNTDDDDMPTPVRYLGAGASQAATEAAVKALPGSTGWYGSTGVNLHLYVHLLDGREPDPLDWWHSEVTQNTTWLIGEGASLLLENIGVFNWQAGVNGAGIRARPISVPAITPRVVHTGGFFLHNFAVVGCSGCGVQIFDIATHAFDYGVIKYVYQDGENIHSFYSTTAGAGDYMYGWSNFVKVDYCGYSLFGGALAPGLSNQVSSAHDSANYVRTNMIGGFTTGSVIADVLGARTWSLNCHVYSPTQGPGHGPAGANDGSPEVAYWCDGALGGMGQRLSRMNVWNSSGRVPLAANEFSATINGTILHAKHIDKITAETYAGGTVTAVP